MFPSSESNRPLLEPFERELVELRTLDAKALLKLHSAKVRGDERLWKLLNRVGLSSHRRPQSAPLATELDPLQRALVLSLADLNTLSWDPLPSRAAMRRRWLELDPPGVLESPVAFEVQGMPRTEPLWRALTLLREQPEAGLEAALIDSLPLERQLGLLEEVDTSGDEPYGIAWPWLEAVWKPTDASVKKWGAQFLPWAQKILSGTDRPVPEHVCAPVLAILLESNEPLPPELDAAIPSFGRDLNSLVERSLSALPEERKLPQLLRLFAEHFGPGEILEPGLRQFMALPDPRLHKLLKKQFSEYPTARHKAALKTLNGLAPTNKSQALQKPRVRKLPEDLLFFDDAVSLTTALSEVLVAQIVATGEAYFGRKRTLAQLLSERAAEGNTFFGNIACFTVAAEKKVAVLDYVHVMGDSGLVFLSGTTDVVGTIVQGGIEAVGDVPASILEKGLARGRR